jgi:hypothetical protein
LDWVVQVLEVVVVMRSGVSGETRGSSDTSSSVFFHILNSPRLQQFQLTDVVVRVCLLM